MAKSAVKEPVPAPKPAVFSSNIKKVDITDLKPSLHNPKSRTDTRSAKMRQTIHNIEEIGLVYPIAVDKSMTIIDGHRRWVACKELGWDTIPVIFVANENVNAVYAGVNSNSEMMSGLQVLQVYLQEPEAVSDRSRRALDKHAERFGRAMLKLLVKNRMSYRLLNTAIQISRYTQDESSEFLDKAANWLIQHRNQRNARSYMALKQQPRKLWDMVNKNRDMEVAFA